MILDLVEADFEILGYNYIDMENDYHFGFDSSLQEYSSAQTELPHLIRARGKFLYAVIPLLLLLFATLTDAQTVVRGQVLDWETQAPLSGANISAIDRDEGTFTEDDGRFELLTGASEIAVSYIGYKTQRIAIEGETLSLTIELKPTATSGIGVVVVEDSPIQRQTAAPVQKILTDQLQRDDGLSIRPALNRVSGVYMHSGALNTNRITIRGIGNRSPFGTTKIRAYFNDIPLTTGVGETTIEDLDLTLLDQVEVWKGPTASVYGAGLGGMIHLKSWGKEVQPTTALSTYYQTGSFGLSRNVNRFKYYSPDEKVQLQLNANFTHSDGYRENNRYDRSSLTALGRIEANEKNEVSFLANYIDLKSFIPSSINQTDFENNPEVAAANWAAIMGFEDYQKLLLGLSNRHFFFKKDSGRNLSNTTSIFATTRTAYEPRPFNILRENSQAMGFRSRFDWNDHQFRGTGDGWAPHLSLGIEYFRENYDWQTYEINDAERGAILSDNQELRRYYNLFWEAHFKFGDKFFSTLGVNLNQTDYQLEDFYLSDGDISGNYDFEAILSPRLGLGYNLSEQVTLFGVVSHGFSSPTLEETLAPEGGINPEIQPERGWNFELGSRGNLWSRLSYDISVFSMQIKDLLVARRTAQDQFVGVNAGKTEHNGLEVFLDYRQPFSSGEWGFFTTYTYADYRFEEFVDGDADYSGNELTGTAPHSVHAGINLDLNAGFYGNINYQFLDAMPMRDDNSIYSDSWQVVNLKLGYKKTIAKRFKLDLHFGVNNIADEHYASMVLINASSFGGAAPRYYYPGLPRHYYGGIQVEVALSD